MHQSIVLAFVAGFMVGGSLGVLIMAALCTASRRYNGAEEV
jgi:hypothetical protein